MPDFDAAACADELATVIREHLAECDAWLAPIGDALTELEKLLTVDGLHPDAAMHARLAIGSLAAVWLTDDELDERALRWTT